MICLARTPAKVQKEKALRGRQLRVKFHAPRRRAGRPPPPHHADPCTYAILYTPYVLLSPCRRRRRRITTRLLGETREVFKQFPKVFGLPKTRKKGQKTGAFPFWFLPPPRRPAAAATPRRPMHVCDTLYTICTLVPVLVVVVVLVLVLVLLIVLDWC